MRKVLELTLEPLDLFALLADDDAGTRRMNAHRYPLGGPLDLDHRDSAVLETLLQVVADEHIFI